MNKDYFLPTISIVAPTYNVEKYVGQFLSTVLNQTFQDFELIIIDDCSTDNSVAIVESFIPKFNGRLHLVKRNTNSGGDAIPKNTGIKLSRGKYLFILDSDDLITKTALEELYNIAEETQADVLHAEKFLIPKDRSDNIDKNTKFIIDTWEQGGFVKNVEIETNNLAERMDLYIKRRFAWYHWNKFFRRDFILENDITLPNLPASSDLIFSFCCLCLAKKYVRIPNVFNIYRPNPDSMTRKNLSNEKYLKKWITILVEGIKIMDDFMDSINFFIKKPEYKYKVIDFYIQEVFNWTNKVYPNISIYKIDEILRKEFSCHLTNSLPTISYLFNISNIYRIRLSQSQFQIRQLQQQITNLQQKN